MGSSITTLYVIRHGETEWNVAGRIQGHSNSALTAKGAAQAEALGVSLQYEKFNAFYSSDLDRAYRTAQAIAQYHPQSVETDVRLREKCLGIFEGLMREEMHSQYPTEHQQYKDNHADYVIPGGGESARQFLQRCGECFDDLARRHPAQTIVIVTHGGVLTNLLKHVVGLPVEAPRRFHALNTSVNVFTYDHAADEWFLERWGDVTHLAQETVNKHFALDEV